LLSDLGNYIFYIPGPHRNLNKLPIPGPIAEAETETEYVIEIIIIREETLSAEETPTSLKVTKNIATRSISLINSQVLIYLL
jgi:hypothetical protein